MTDIVVRPVPFPGALKNPLMGFRPGLGQSHEWASLVKDYIRWNELENAAGDGVEKVKAVCDARWKSLPASGIKVVPRVYLEWPNRGKYWPSDLTPGDYDSPPFLRRLLQMVEKLGAAWDGDGRVAWVEMGLIGFWGEHHHPEPTAKMQTLLGDAFLRAFHRKLILRRNPRHFREYPFGIYWDSFAHPQEQADMEAGLTSLGDSWKTLPRGGECAYDWGDYKVQPGLNPTDTVKNPVHRDFLVNLIRRLHWNHLGWVADYDAKDADARVGAALVQMAFGYRFVIAEARVPARLTPGKPFSVTLVLRNEGATPLYGSWPLQLSLLDGKTRKSVWTENFDGVDVRTWLPGDRWDDTRQAYLVPPKAQKIVGTFTLPASAPHGDFALAVALLDPAGKRPAVRFAVQNYWRGGHHPLAAVGVGQAARGKLPPFDDPNADTLSYAHSA